MIEDRLVARADKDTKGIGEKGFETGRSEEYESVDDGRWSDGECRNRSNATQNVFREVKKNKRQTKIGGANEKNNKTVEKNNDQS